MGNLISMYVLISFTKSHLHLDKARNIVIATPMSSSTYLLRLKYLNTMHFDHRILLVLRKSPGIKTFLLCVLNPNNTVSPRTVVAEKKKKKKKKKKKYSR